MHVIDDSDYASLFGMGIVNAGRAVQGPGWLDAHRLGKGDRKSYDGEDFAMYPVDTKGYDAVWSNDIQEVCIGVCPGAQNANYPDREFAPTYVDAEVAKSLDGLSVGLVKRGEGTLTLAGRNAYHGPTVVEGGTVSLGTPDQADGAASLAGSVVVESAGTFTGNGLVDGNLAFHGLLVPGHASRLGSALTITGGVTGGGTLLVPASPDGRSNTLKVGKSVALEGTRILMADVAGGAMPASSYVFIEAAEGITGTPANSSATVLQGSTLLHDYGFATRSAETESPQIQGASLQRTARTSEATPAPMSLVASRIASRARPEAKALSEGHIAGLALLGAGADLAAGMGIDAAKSAVSISGGDGLVMGPFAALSAGSARHETGSHVDVRSLALLAGFAIGGRTGMGDLTFGAFFEFGEGSYDTCNSFPGSSVHGAGNASHIGGGLLGRVDFLKFGPGRPHIEASARAGRVRNTYRSDDLTDFRGTPAEFEANAPYLGWHVGAGYAFDIPGDLSFDVYGQYLATRTFGESVTLSTGDPVRFDDAMSSRIRAGGRLAYEGGQVARPFVGIAWEREFDGRQRAHVNGVPFDSPAMTGDTGIAEIGLVIKPAENRPLTVELGAQGYVGMRRGVSGHVQVRFEF
ncbi:MAG: autotransporter domain-containing protein [Desulfovibrio sp.]|nr:autotransporter domain-containing protein [Desulfovibrio sp.]